MYVLMKDYNSITIVSRPYTPITKTMAEKLRINQRAMERTMLGIAPIVRDKIQNIGHHGKSCTSQMKMGRTCSKNGGPKGG